MLKAFTSFPKNLSFVSLKLKRKKVTTVKNTKGTKERIAKARTRCSSVNLVGKGLASRQESSFQTALEVGNEQKKPRLPWGTVTSY